MTTIIRMQKAVYGGLYIWIKIKFLQFENVNYGK